MPEIICGAVESMQPFTICGSRTMGTMDAFHKMVDIMRIIALTNYEVRIQTIKMFLFVRKQFNTKSLPKCNFINEISLFNAFIDLNVFYFVYCFAINSTFIKL